MLPAKTFPMFVRAVGITLLPMVAGLRLTRRTLLWSGARPVANIACLSLGDRGSPREPIET